MSNYRRHKGSNGQPPPNFQFPRSFPGCGRFTFVYYADCCKSPDQPGPPHLRACPNPLLTVLKCLVSFLHFACRCAQGDDVIGQEAGLAMDAGGAKANGRADGDLSCEGKAPYCTLEITPAPPPPPPPRAPKERLIVFI